MSEELLAEYPVIVRVPVQWGDMDAYGHVNNAMFFRFFESARIRYLERCGFIASYDRDKIGAILHSTHARFRLPLFYPDMALVGTRATQVDEDRFTMAYLLVSEREGAVAADGAGVVVSYDYNARRVAPIPADVRAAIEHLERAAG